LEKRIWLKIARFYYRAPRPDGPSIAPRFQFTWGYGLRHTHQLEMISCGISLVSEEFLNALTNLTNTLAAGWAARDIAPWLCGAPHTALS
jgi:hypothetical protein